MSVELRELGYRAQADRSDARRLGRSVLVIEGAVLPLDESLDRPLTLGSLEDRDVTIQGEGVSRDHAKLLRFARRWTLEDNSLNGTLVRRLGSSRPWWIHHERFDLEDRDTFRCAGGPWILYEKNDPGGTARVVPEDDVSGAVSLHDLTERESDVVKIFLTRWFDGEDSSNGALAAALYLSVETVKTHIAHIRQKWDCRSREDIVRRALEAGLLPDRPAPRQGS